MPKALFSTILACGILFSTQGQTIRLSLTKPANAVKVVNGNYNIYLANQDLLAGIAKIDEVMKTDHHELSLLYHSKATIFKGTKMVGSIVAKDGPPEVEDDGSAAFPTRFTENGIDEEVFLGHMSKS